MKVNVLRKIARKPESQLIYNTAKELGNIRLFRNDMDFTVVQILFLHWLGIYSSLYTDLAINKPHISEAVIKDDLRAEAYLVWRHEEDKKESEKDTKDTPVNNTGIPSIVFTPKK